MKCKCQTTHTVVSVERSRRMRTSEMSWQSSARNIAELLDINWKTRTAILNWTRCHTANQCSCRRISVMWSWRRAVSLAGVLGRLYATHHPSAECVTILQSTRYKGCLGSVSRQWPRYFRSW